MNIAALTSLATSKNNGLAPQRAQQRIERARTERINRYVDKPGTGEFGDNPFWCWLHGQPHNNTLHPNDRRDPTLGAASRSLKENPYRLPYKEIRDDEIYQGLLQEYTQAATNLASFNDPRNWPLREHLEKAKATKRDQLDNYVRDRLTQIEKERGQYVPFLRMHDREKKLGLPNGVVEKKIVPFLGNLGD